MTTQYKFWFKGAWRPVLNMFRGQNEVFHPEQAGSVVILVENSGFVAAEATPAEIFSTGASAGRAGGVWDDL